MKQNNSSREEILKRIEAARKGRSSFREVSTDETKPVYKPIQPDAVTCFKNELEAINGQCVVYDDEQDMYAGLAQFVAERGFPYLYCSDNDIAGCLDEAGVPYSNNEADFEAMQAGVTACEFLIARTGSVMVSSASSHGRQMHIFPPVHIVVAKSSQLVDYVEDALKAVQAKYPDGLPSAITTITGPSRTADIEKTLVLGAHGPKEFVVFLSKN
ncbi:hypothetical protein D0T49_05280 [Paludibacter sp. 221]|uniref:LutC/YkgG family protein n=1 Tax=Paludibacter sp. 221 TaxID=2302939 RepID=UPI0013D7D374|nr:lactate utilization protein [Paludibacter sp. 221]NDV46452.1 hypothetical protein [Paludibacter sp. 221]